MTRVRFLVGLLVLAPSLVAGQGTEAPGPFVREGVTVQLGPHTYAIPDGGVGGVPNVGIVVGQRATLVIDPGLGRLNGEAVLREVAKVSSHTEVYIATTHYHPEHTTGYIAFPASARYVNSTVQEAEFADAGQQSIETFSARTPVMAELLSDARRRVADITFERGAVLDLGGVAVRMRVVGPTHTRGDTGIFVSADGVLFSGDVVMNESFVAANAGSSITAWLAALDTFEAMRPSTIVPAHGPIADASSIQVLRDIVERIRTRAIELKSEGRSADEAATTIQAELTAEYPSWPRANGIAALARSAWTEAR
jgi:glyoxylase-like metal-dependent hydrolase (beta-lactamase superfamily II)